MLFFRKSLLVQYRLVEKKGEGDSRSLKESRVLVVDDSQQIRRVITEILEVHGYNVDTAESATVALQRLTESEPDIILCDIMMPGIDGISLRKELKENPEWCSIPFVFVTALNSSSNICQGEEVGCDAYLCKPFNPEELLSVIKGRLHIAQQRRLMIERKLEHYRRRIVHTLSHEFRTPLVSINTGAELLLDRHNSLEDEQITNLLQSILRGGQRLERLVNDFMILQQIDLGQAQHSYELYRKPYPLLSIIHSAIESHQRSLVKGVSEVELLVPSEEILSTLYVRVYDIQVTDALQRLLSNAHKFSDRSQAIKIRIEVDDDMAAIVVADRGLAVQNVEQDFAQEACKPLSQIDRETLEQQGCGLGLTIAHYFTTLNGGALDFRALKAEDGLEVVMRFPLSKAHL